MSSGPATCLPADRYAVTPAQAQTQALTGVAAAIGTKISTAYFHANIYKSNPVIPYAVRNAANFYRKSYACTKAFFTINFIQTNQHYYLNPNFQGGPTPVGGDYYFKVK